MTRDSARDRALLLFMVTYGAASLLHFAHNAVHLGEYPNMPPFLTARVVWLAWLAITMVGVIGAWLYLRVSQLAGALVIAGYALLGFGGLDHYAIAPVGAHSMPMHATIVAEAVTAAALLIFVARHSRRSW
jgi:hypothetical protein